MRPGAAPGPPRRPRHQGPTPRYAFIPRWGLLDPATQVRPPEAVPARSGPGPATVRRTLTATAVVLGVAALAHLLRYVLLLVNRSVLLNPLLASTAVWFGVAASIAAVLAVIGCAVVLTRWLIARRAAVFAHYHRSEPRPEWSLWAGCLVPLVNLAWAPVYVLEMATAEGAASRMRKPVTVWWVLWLLSTATSVFATATSFTAEAQGIADNTVSTVLAYLLATATVVVMGRVYDGFERKPVERPAHRWVMVGAEAPAEQSVERPSSGESAVAVERAGREPAA